MLRAIKLRLDEIVIDPKTTDAIKLLVYDIHEITSITYEFLKLFIIYQNKNGKSLPNINEAFVRKVISYITIKNDGRGKPKNEEEIGIYLRQYYESEFKPLLGNAVYIRSNKTHILYDYIADDIVKNYNNNIQMHFIQRVQKYINIIYVDVLDKEFQDVIKYAQFKSEQIKLLRNTNKDSIKHNNKEYKKKERTFIKNLDNNNKHIIIRKKEYEKRKEILMKELRYVKNGIIGKSNDYMPINFRNEMENKYSKEILDLKKLLLPNLTNELEDELEKIPSKFIPNMITINDKLELLEKRTNNMMPLRTSLIPKFITLDTQCIVESLNGNQDQDLSKSNPEKIWLKYFSYKKGIHWNKEKNYIFNNMIMTDGYSVSIIQIRSKLYDVNREKRKWKDDEKNYYKKIMQEKENEIKYINKVDNKEKERLLELIAKKEETILIKLLTLFPEEDIESIYEMAKNIKPPNFVGIDQGKNRLIQAIDEKGTKFTYSSAQRKYELGIKTHRERRKEILESDPLVKEIIENFNESSKTTNYDKFKKYIRDKHEIIKLVEEHYQQEIYRKLHFHKYIKEKKSESKLIKEIKKTYGKDIIIGVGNWKEGKTKANNESTKGIGMRRLIKRNFKETYLIDEFKTSKICCKCGNENEYYKKVVNRETYKKDGTHVHGLLCCKNKNCSTLWNRDVNASINMLKILIYEIYFNARPFWLQRH